MGSVAFGELCSSHLIAGRVNPRSTVAEVRTSLDPPADPHDVPKRCAKLWFVTVNDEERTLTEVRFAGVLEHHALPRMIVGVLRRHDDVKG